jgi:YVTN family beta-propeller protein
MRYLSFILLFVFFAFSNPESTYLSPGSIVVNNKQNLAYTALTTAKTVAVTDLKTGQTTVGIKLKQDPNRLLLSPDGSTLFVSAGSAQGTVDIVSLPEGKVKSSIKIGHTPQEMALSQDGKVLYVTNRFSNSISVIDLSKKKVIKTIPVVREPRSIVISPDGKTLATGNFLPAQAGTDPVVASEITLIDIASETATHITLENGSQSLMGLTYSSDGKYLYAVHILSRFGVPITQLDRGWVNTNALSIIDAENKSLYAVVLMDDVDHGAANPTQTGIGEDGKLYVTLSGTHQLMTLDLKPMHEELDALFSGKIKDAYIKTKEDLSASLSFTSPFKKRINLKGQLPQYLAFSKDAVLVSSRFSTFLEQIPLSGDKPATTLSLGTEPQPDAVRRGELAFNDASICYQQWQSCASCHPDGRADGLNWDQQNDGLGNPKNTKSLLYSHVTPPCMITGVRENAEKAVRNGILHTLQTVQPEEVAVGMDEYLKNLTPLESPYWAEYKKSKQKGKKLFESAGCAQCHAGKYSTDQQKYNVGTGDGDDKNRAFDTPSLHEIWRTAPYLYDGRATTLQEVFTKFNVDDKHGATKSLNKEDLEALILYINTL